MWTDCTNEEITGTTNTPTGTKKAAEVKEISFVTSLFGIYIWNTRGKLALIFSVTSNHPKSGFNAPPILLWMLKYSFGRGQAWLFWHLFNRNSYIDDGGRGERLYALFSFLNHEIVTDTSNICTIYLFGVWISFDGGNIQDCQTPYWGQFSSKQIYLEGKKRKKGFMASIIEEMISSQQ